MFPFSRRPSSPRNSRLADAACRARDSARDSARAARWPVHLVFPAVLLAVVGSSLAADAPGPGFVRDGDLFVDLQPSARGVMHAGEQLWDYGIIPVWIDPGLDSTLADKARGAMSVWNTVAGVTLLEITTPAPPEFDVVHLQSGDGCASWVGRRGGAQELWIAPDCSSGSVIHELGHVIGLEHEHTRGDRDAWINIHWENVRADKRHNFDVAPEGSRLLGDYDYESIMHYGPDYFSVNGLATIEPTDPEARIGQRVAPSAGDIASVAELYGTDLAITADLYAITDSDVHELDVIVSNNGERGSHAIEFDLATPQDWTVLGAAVTTDHWTCGSGDSEKREADVPPVTTCQLQRLAAGEQARVTLSLTRQPLQAGIPDAGAALAVAPLQLSLRARTDELDPYDNVWQVTGEHGADGSRLSIAGVQTSSEDAEGSVVNPFAVEQEDDDSALYSPLLADGASSDDASVSVGGALNPASGCFLMMLLAWQRRRYCVGTGTAP